VSGEQADAGLSRAAEALRPALGDAFYGEEKTDLAAVLLEQLRAAGMQLAVAESCTGGLMGSRITAVPGASDVFAGGVIAYSNASKVRDLGVPEQLLTRNGAVSEAVAEAMALGIRRRFGTEGGIAVTGVAGPTGGSADKPVCTVCLAAAVGRHRLTVTRRLPGDRGAIRARSAQASLDLARRLLLED
jgi:nicotinamide-nucleotide amidase